MLFTFRRAMLEFTKWSELRLRQVGLTPQQYLLLLSLRVREGGHGLRAPRMGDVADDLLIAPNSAVELVTRAEALGLVRRTRDAADQRVVRITLTTHGQELLVELASAHLAELERAAGALHISEEFLGTLAAAYLGRDRDPEKDRRENA